MELEPGYNATGGGEALAQPDAGGVYYLGHVLPEKT
jgi:hypothetical protein